MRHRTHPALALLCLVFLHGCGSLPARAQAQPIRSTVGQLFTCSASSDGLEIIVTDPVDATDCTTGLGTAAPHPCWCDGTTTTWTAGAAALDPDDFVAVIGDTMTGALTIDGANLTLDGGKLIVDHPGASIMELCDDVTANCWLTFNTAAGDITLFGIAAQGPFIARSQSTDDLFQFRNHLNQKQITFDTDFNLGLGHLLDPTEAIHVVRSNAASTLVELENTNVVDQAVGLNLINVSESWGARLASNGDFNIRKLGGNIIFTIDSAAVANLLQVGVVATDMVDVNGDLDVSADLTVDGDVGIGVTPTEAFHLVRTDANPTFALIDNTNVTDQTTGLRLFNDGQDWQLRNNSLGVFDVSLVGGNIGLSIHHQVDNNLVQIGHNGGGHVDINGTCTGCIGDEARVNGTVSTPTSLTAGSWTTFTWTEVDDTDTMYGGSGAASINTAGTYVVTAHVCLDGSGWPMAGRIQNGGGSTTYAQCSTEISSTWTANDETCTVCSITRSFTDTDNLRFQFIADESGQSAKTVNSGHFSITRVH